MITYNELLTYWKKGMRNKNWRKLDIVEKAFYRASLSYTKIQSKIVNTKIVEQLSALVDKLLETPVARVFKRGFDRATEMLKKYEESGVFNWAPQLRNWLKDPDYMLWLGTFSAWG